MPWVPELCLWNLVRGRHFSKWSLRILSQMVSALPLSGKLGELQDHAGKLCGAPRMEEMIIFAVPATRKVKTLCLLGMRVEGLALQLETGKPPRQWGSGGLQCRQRECSFAVCCRAGKASWGDDPFHSLVPHTSSLKQTPAPTLLPTCDILSVSPTLTM